MLFIFVTYKLFICSSVCHQPHRDMKSDQWTSLVLFLFVLSAIENVNECRGTNNNTTCTEQGHNWWIQCIPSSFWLLALLLNIEGLIFVKCFNACLLCQLWLEASCFWVVSTYVCAILVDIIFQEQLQGISPNVNAHQGTNWLDLLWPPVTISVPY